MCVVAHGPADQGQWVLAAEAEKAQGEAEASLAQYEAEKAAFNDLANLNLGVGPLVRAAAREDWSW